MKKVVLFNLAVLVLFTGCATMWESVSIGKLKGKAEEEGMDYADTGVIADPYFIYMNRKQLDPAKVYPNSKCRSSAQEKLLINSEDN